MTQWTDDDIAEQLRDTFARHENDVDASVALRIALAARPARRPQWALLTAAAAVVLIAGVTFVAVHTSGSTNQPDILRSNSTAPAPTPDNAAAAPSNRDLARAETARVLKAVPVPTGSTESDVPPAASLHRVGCACGEVDPSLTRTTWWVVPLGYRDLVAWYVAHPPAKTAPGHGDSPDAYTSRGEFDWQINAQSDSYSDPYVVITYAELDAHTTAIRIDVTLAARYERTPDTLVPDSVTSVDVTKSAIDGPDTSPTTVTITDQTIVSPIISAFNALPGAFADSGLHGCGSPVGLEYAYAVTFHWPGHTLVVDSGAPLCDVGRGLTLDGTKLPQTLEPDDSLDHALQQALDAAH